MKKEGPIGPDAVLGDIIRTYPSLREKIGELFGKECLQCGSNKRETLVYTSWHKGLDPGKVCRELNELLKK